jgi:hypothetical protein
MEKQKESQKSYEDRIIDYKLTKEEYFEKIL